MSTATSQSIPPASINGLTFTEYYLSSTIHRHWTEPDGTVRESSVGVEDPFDTVKWEKRTASITDSKGKVIFEQHNVEVPSTWSQTATNIVASKYFHGKLGSPERESSVRQLISRVANTIAEWGFEQGYFASLRDKAVFRCELIYILLHQIAAFNSPVWFNVGTPKTCHGYIWDESLQTVRPVAGSEHKPQSAACYINKVEDNMGSILDLAKTEGMLFKGGSGAGSNLSALREQNSSLSAGGSASGPLSFMKGFDAFAGVIKSAGQARRAAKMVILNADHPDIEKFIWCKVLEEKKAKILISAGYDPAIDGEAYGSVFYQNSNNSVRVTDEFMEAVVNNSDWTLVSRVDSSIKHTIKARQIMHDIAEATWQCGDPGMQFDTTANKWHTAPAHGRQNASNPCSEFLWIDDSACNLASMNLMKFMYDNVFNMAAMRYTTRVLITAQEILVDNSSYPASTIAKNSHDLRPLGLGYANLGSLLMSCGLAYDSDAGRDFAGSISSVMTGQAYLTSAEIAGVKGPMPGWEPNRKSFLNVISMHLTEAEKLAERTSKDIQFNVNKVWHEAEHLGRKNGYRNGQMTVCAPTGTIGFMMDCTTTGLEPELALVKYKKLVGGGIIKLVNDTVPSALDTLGYTVSDIKAITDYIDSTGTIEGAPAIKPEHLSVFDCSFRPQNGSRSIHYMGHLKMMGAVQPFFSGALSKTINVPEECTPQTIMDAYIESWRMGLKSVAIYRDNSKGSQPLNTGAGSKKEAEVENAIAATTTATVDVQPTIQHICQPVRRRLHDERHSITHKFSIGGHEGYITVGMFDDGTPGEIFVTMAKEGSTISGLVDTFATAVSYCLQYGVELKFLSSKFRHVRFEPSGWTGNQQIPYAKSIPDYIFQWLELKFGITDQTVTGEVAVDYTQQITSAPTSVTVQSHTPTCAECGSLTEPNGKCFKCPNCGGSSGCS